MSIVEGLNPVRRARFTAAKADEVISAQTIHLKDSPTLRRVTAGAKYHYAGRDGVCAPEEFILLGGPNGVLLISNRSINPSVVAVAPEMFQPAK